MINNIYTILIGCVMLTSVFVSYRFNESLKEQSLLVYEFNKYNLTAPLALIESFNDDFPSITNTTLPIATLKGKYYLRDSMINQALAYFHKGKRQNKYLKLSEFELAKFYYNKKQLDSAYYYSKIAFDALPRNVLYSNIYFKTLTKLKYGEELDSAFVKVKDFKVFDQWSNYIFAKLEINPSNKEALNSILAEFKDFAEGSSRIKTMESIINIGYENLSELGSLVLKAEELFATGNFFEAAILELKASNLDPLDYVHLENAAISFYKANEFELAEKTFIQVMDDYPNRKNGKTEFFYGIMNIEMGVQKKGCEYLTIAQQQIYPGAKQVIDLYCTP